MFVVKRSSHNPLISPLKAHAWEELSTCNGSAVRDGKTDDIHILYRAIARPDSMQAPDLSRSSIGYTKSKDGVHFSDRRQLIKPEEDWERFGCEDPRVTYIDGSYFIFYTALSQYPLQADGIRIAVAISKDLKTIDARHLVTPFNAKAMVLFPEKIAGKYVAMLTVHTDKPPSRIAFAHFEHLSDLWSESYWKAWYENWEHHAIDLRRSDQDHVEVGAVPIKTEKGWLFIYSHIQNYFSANKVFGIEALLLDEKDPRKIICRSEGPFIVPQEIYEKYGLIPDITFPTGALVYKDQLDIYYGATDTTSCRASVNLKDLLRSIDPKERMQEVQRSKHNPILEPIKENKWESRNVFNPAAIDINGTVYILYRAMSEDNTSSIGLAQSTDGQSIDYRHPEPIYVPREAFEQKMGKADGNSGCEDPRISRIGNTLYMAYTAFDGVHVPRVTISSISVRDFLKKEWNWSQPILITPGEVDDKDACVLPEKVKGQYVIFHRVASHICADFSPTLDFKPGQVNKCFEVLEPRKGMWDSMKVGVGPPPIKTEKGWLLFYHGISEHAVYRVGAALLDLHDPTIVLARSADPIFEPREKYEKEGEVSKVVFPCGAVVRDGRILLYYGAADRVVGVAELSLSKTLEALSRDVF